MGFSDFSVDCDLEGRRVAILISDGEWLKEWLPKLIGDFTHLARLIGKRLNIDDGIYVDLNNYRKDREKIIVELAKAAARKAAITKNEVKLPAMNAYERRLVHTELATRPDVMTESLGEKSERCVIVKPLS
jgi:spoIIIJ-associated protein